MILVAFLIFIILYCLFNYQLIEGFPNQIKVDRATGIATPATQEDISTRNAIEQMAMETREINETIKMGNQYDRMESMGAAKRMVENIDGEKGKAMEEKAAKEMKSIIDTGSRPLMPTPKQRKTDQIAAQNSLNAVSKVQEQVKKLQDDAMKRSKKLTKELQAFGKEAIKSTPLMEAANPFSSAKQNPFSLATQDENEIKGAGSDITKLKKQRNDLANELSCEKRCKLLYNATFICDNGDCLCKNMENYKKHGTCHNSEINRGDS